MSCNSCGCCLGIVFGFLFALAVLVAAAFGIYCYFNPEARNTGIDVVEVQWGKIKNGGDELIEQSRSIGAPAPEPRTVPAGGGPRSIPEPVVGRPQPLTDPDR